jgi:hypothetical protein
MVDRLDDVPPIGGVVAGAERGLQIAHMAPIRLIGRQNQRRTKSPSPPRVKRIVDADQ